MSRRSRTFALSGALVIALSVVLAVINISEWDVLRLSAFLFILWVELCLFGGLILLDKAAVATEQVLFRSGASVVLVLYCLLSLAVSVSFMAWRQWSAASLLTIQISLLVLAVVLITVIWTVGRGVKEKNNQTLGTYRNIESLIDRLNLLAGRVQDSPYAELLRGLAEELRFTDLSTAVLVDGELEPAVSSLEIELKMYGADQSSDKADELLGRLNSLIAQRKADVAATKQGGI